MNTLCRLCHSPVPYAALTCNQCGAVLAPPGSPAMGHVMASMQPPTHPLAIVSLVSSLVGLTIAPCIAGIAAVVTGHMARREMQANPGRYSGDGLALAGLLIGYGQMVLWVLAMLVFLVFLVIAN
jgi:hypothetical protein